MKLRGLLYWLAKLLGDLGALQKGKVGRRAGRRMAGKGASRILRRLFPK